ncbi:MAG: hypothetical protein AAGF54_19230 [Pseudomonadota bacterium]
MIGETILKQARNDLEHRVTALNSVQFGDVISRDFSFEEIRAGFERGAMSTWIKPLLGKGNDHAAIYRISVNNKAGADRLRHAFVNYDPQDGHVLSRNNEITNSTVVYVGSSQKFGQRLQQHLHTCAAGTYALKMNLWCPDADNRICVEVQMVRGAVEASLVQDIEDALWRISRPIFGKFGSR